MRDYTVGALATFRKECLRSQIGLLLQAKGSPPIMYNWDNFRVAIEYRKYSSYDEIFEHIHIALAEGLLR